MLEKVIGSRELFGTFLRLGMQPRRSHSSQVEFLGVFLKDWVPGQLQTLPKKEAIKRFLLLFGEWRHCGG